MSDVQSEFTRFMQGFLAENPHVANALGCTSAPVWRYFRGPRGEKFGWTTERDDKGKFYAFTYAPIGKGSKSGKPTKWKLTHKVAFATRKAARARAESRLMNARLIKENRS